MLKKKEPTTQLYVRGITIKNKKFLNVLAKEYNYKMGEVLNSLIETQRSKYESGRKRRTSSKSKN